MKEHSLNVSHCEQRCVDVYPWIDNLRISVILTDTDRIQIVIALFEWIQIPILCHGYSTDIHYVCILFNVLFLLLFSIVNIRHSRHRHHGLQVIEYRVINAILR